MKHYSWVAERNQTVPSVHITTNKSRRKRYNNESTKPVYYLKHGEEFQLEIHNPTSDILKAEIWLNGKLTSTSGLVLKPGERVFLDRYLDSPQKFLFETYSVSNTNASKNAIKNNGNVEVKFYKEIPPQTWMKSWNTYNNDHVYYGRSGTGDTDPFTYTTNGFVGTSATTNFDMSSSNVTNTSNFCSTDISGTLTLTGLDSKSLICDSPAPIREVMTTYKPKKKSIETGMVGKGSSSDQSFKSVHYDFEYTPVYVVQYEILPESQKQTTVDDLNTAKYCTKCGTKIKPTHKFCPTCGTKIN